MKARDKFRELNLSNAFLFAAVMNDAEVCRLVLEILTGEPVEAVNVQSEQSILFSSDFRSVRLDVYARDCLEVEYDLEIENGGESLPKRSRYYQSQMDVAALKPGDDVDLLGLSYVYFCVPLILLMRDCIVIVLKIPAPKQETAWETERKRYF